MDTHLPRDRRAWAAGLVAVAVLGYVGFAYLAPHASTTVHEAAPDGPVMKQGAFHDGEPGHHASGTVMVVQTADGYALRLEDYDATAGPDVFFFLTEQPGARSTADVERGLRVLVPGGADGGEATLRGDFNVPLPAGFDPARWQGLAAWCDGFNVLFGSAALA
jgi:hypothetical protein